MKRESLDEQVRRTKARWLRRVMYDVRPNATAKCLAYLVADRLNCVTCDCWPAQSTIATWLGVASLRTVQRAARSLQHLGYLTIKPRVDGAAGYRYAPTFSSDDMDNPARKNGQACPVDTDTAVTESSSGIHLKSSSTSSSGAKQTNSGSGREVHYRQSQRGQIELWVADLLGEDGIQVLACLASIDDAIVERLCRAYVEHSLGRRELEAARLAAQHYQATARQSRRRCLVSTAPQSDNRP
jgi:hypothetical protein